MSTILKKYFPAGTPVKWSASAEDYITESGELILNDDTTLTIKLKSSRILFSWDGGGTKTVWFGDKKMTSTSPIYLGDDGLMTEFDFGSDFSKDSTTKNIFIDAEGLLNKSTILYGLFNYDTNKIENVEIINSSHLTSFEGIFSNMKYIKTVSIDTSGATTLLQMFANSAIENPPLLNTNNVTNVRGMFYNCTNLKYIPQYDFSKVTDMFGTFEYCSNITSIPYLDTHNVKDVYGCFAGCTKLKSVPLLDFSKVTSADILFYKCSSLTDVGGFTGLKTDIDFIYSPLTHASALNVIDNLPVSSGYTVDFNKTTFDTLTSAEIARATDKGWTITYTAMEL